MALVKTKPRKKTKAKKQDNLLVKLVKRAAMVIGAVTLTAVVASCGHNYYPQKGDNRPHKGVARAHTLPIHGIDVSRHNGNIDWNRVASAGTRFAFIKATDGGDHLDPMFRTNWEGARRAGIPRGAYHFVYWCRPANEQVAWFAANVPADPQALPPVLDLEWNNGSSCKHTLTKQEVIAKVNVLLAGMEAHTGKVPIIYTDINFHRDILEGMDIDNTMWLRSTAAQPHERFKNRPWALWQYTQTGTIPGIRGEVDRNAWFSSEGDWQGFLRTGCEPRKYAVLAAQGRCGTL